MSTAKLTTDELARYREPIDGPLRFIREQCLLADGRRVGEAMAGDEWIERDLLRPVFERDEDGLPRHRLVYLELPRGHWKSGGAAAVAMAQALLEPDSDLVIAAADREQAGVIGENISGFLARNPALRRSFRESKDLFEVPARHSRIRVISSDAPSAWGLGGTHRRFRVIADELTAWPERGEQLWQALVSATGKTPDAQTLILSNAGFGRDSCWQWKVRETAEREDWAYLYGAPGIVASWITEAWIEQMRALLPPAAFERVILNRWSSSAGDFVSTEQYARIVDSQLRPRIGGKGRFFAGLDLGLRRDRTAFAIVEAKPDGSIELAEMQTWIPRPGDPVSPTAVERAVADAAERYRRLEVLADPWQLESAVERLTAAGVRVERHTFTSSSWQKLSTALYGAITSGRLRVYPDEELEREVVGLRVLQTPSGWRFDHTLGAFSDRATALAMAVARAIEKAPRAADPRFRNRAAVLWRDHRGQWHTDVRPGEASRAASEYGDGDELLDPRATSAAERGDDGRFEPIEVDPGPEQKPPRVLHPVERAKLRPPRGECRFCHTRHANEPRRVSRLSDVCSQCMRPENRPGV